MSMNSDKIETMKLHELKKALIFYNKAFGDDKVECSGCGQVEYACNAVTSWVGPRLCNTICKYRIS